MLTQYVGSGFSQLLCVSLSAVCLSAVRCCDSGPGTGISQQARASCHSHHPNATKKRRFTIPRISGFDIPVDRIVSPHDDGRTSSITPTLANLPTLLPTTYLTSKPAGQASSTYRAESLSLLEDWTGLGTGPSVAGTGYDGFRRELLPPGGIGRSFVFRLCHPPTKEQ
ncbi:hypothetical protein B0H65DRAFT_49714 [Neurospora tetraspora]|uniref:Secreted protein n=1 Tax=Neurospora tetraspora TaxID=94610 RepID=A0AAE0JPR3_9PEZI|nr:hypothetical protein B0H65DRAFT_49714 [Neurospora tetraspora]